MAELGEDGPLARRPRDETAVIRGRYDRIAPVYDLSDWMMERRFGDARAELWTRVEGDQILEVGAGTGKSVPHYPPGRQVTGIDLSPRMLARARRRADELGVEARFVEADAQALPFADGTFDTAVTTFVFCSVPDPVQGLREVRRVLKPGGKLLMLEHVLSQRPILRWIMRRLDWLPYHLWGAHIDRDTLDNVRRAGFADVVDTDLSLDVVKRIEARAPADER